MATYVKGNAVANATSYELFENADGTYTSLATADEINFEVSALSLAAGAHVLVVQAHADGYTSSPYSDPVTYTAEGSTSGGEDEGGDTVDTNLMHVEARLDENTVFVSGNADTTHWGPFRSAVVSVENDYVKIDGSAIDTSLWGIRMGVPDTIPEGTSSVNVSVWVRTDDTAWYEDQWFRLYADGSSKVKTFKPTTEWVQVTTTWAWDGAWDRLQISSPTANKKGILYVKDFCVEVAG